MTTVATQKLTVADLEAAAMSLIRARETNLGFEVELPVIYPNGQCVSVVITVVGGQHVVHDAGHGAMYLTDSGITLTKQLSEKLKRLADAYGCEFISGRMTKSCNPRQLAIAIALVANASRAVGDQMFEQREGRLRDFRREVATTVAKSVPERRLKHSLQIIGQSGTSYHVSNVVLGDDAQTELAFVEPIADQSAVDRRVREFFDIASNSEYASVQRIAVYDDRISWRDGDLAVLTRVSNIVPFSILPTRLERLAA